MIRSSRERLYAVLGGTLLLLTGCAHSKPIFYTPGRTSPPRILSGGPQQRPAGGAPIRRSARPAELGRDG